MHSLQFFETELDIALDEGGRNRKGRANNSVGSSTGSLIFATWLEVLICPFSSFLDSFLLSLFEVSMVSGRIHDNVEEGGRGWEEEEEERHRVPSNE